VLSRARQAVEGPIDLVGFCMGGATALLYAARWPGRVRRLSLLAPAAVLRLDSYELTLRIHRYQAQEHECASPPEARGGAGSAAPPPPPKQKQQKQRMSSTSTSTSTKTPPPPPPPAADAAAPSRQVRVQLSRRGERRAHVRRRWPPAVRDGQGGADDGGAPPARPAQLLVVHLAGALPPRPDLG
jgi:pimeloyl-ACP methyl ester carboxylesterase